MLLLIEIFYRVSLGAMQFQPNTDFKTKMTSYFFMNKHLVKVKYQHIKLLVMVPFILTKKLICFKNKAK